MGKRSVRLGGEDGKDGIFLERVKSGARWEIFSMWSKRCAVGLTEQGDRAIREGPTTERLEQLNVVKGRNREFTGNTH
jgi:hypothetical protein